MKAHDIQRLQDAYAIVAELLIDDAVYLPIFLRIEAEIANTQIDGDTSLDSSRANFESRTIARRKTGDLRL